MEFEKRYVDASSDSDDDDDGPKVTVACRCCRKIRESLG